MTDSRRPGTRSGRILYNGKVLRSPLLATSEVSFVMQHDSPAMQFTVEEVRAVCLRVCVCVCVWTDVVGGVSRRRHS